MGLYSTVTEAIGQYMGLSPAAFFTIMALTVVVCGMFVAADHYMAVKRENSFALREPVQLGDVTEDELRGYDGSDPNKPLLMAIKGNIYDVSRSRMFYGPGGPYALFAGRDVSRAFALMSFEPQDLTGNVDGLSGSELEGLQGMEYKFMEMYVRVGQLVSERVRTEQNMGGGKMVRTYQTTRKTTSGVPDNTLPDMIPKEDYLEERKEVLKLKNKLIVKEARHEELKAENETLKEQLTEIQQAVDELMKMVNKLSSEGTKYNSIQLDDEEDEAPPMEPEDPMKDDSDMDQMRIRKKRTKKSQ